MVSDLHCIVFCQSICYLNMYSSRISLITIRAVQFKCNMIICGFFYLPHSLVIKIHSAVEIIAIIILLAPFLYQKLHECKLTRLACVLTFIGTLGAYCFNVSITPPSAAIIPSGFISSNFFAISIISGYVSSQAYIFKATYTFFPILCAYFIVCIKSSSCISALDLNDNDAVPQYTASAPYKNAIFAFSNDPAGANNSISFTLFFSFLLSR